MGSLGGRERGGGNRDCQDGGKRKIAVYLVVCIRLFPVLFLS